jgi:signal peptidase I
MTTLLMFAGIGLGLMIVYAGILTLLARRSSALRPNFLRALAVSILFVAFGLVVGWLLNPTGPGLAPIAVTVRTALIVAIGALGGIRIVQFLLQTSYGHACYLWLLSTLIVAGIGAGLFVYALKPYAFPTGTVVGNAMAPTLVGWHRVDVCPLCGGRRILPASDPATTDTEVVDDKSSLPGICAKCRKISRFKDGAEALKQLPIEPPDLFLANKLLTAKRWDMIVYRMPQNRDTLVKRLIGLPGETVLLKDGGVWVDGVRLEPPAEIAGLEFGPIANRIVALQFGTPSRPWTIEPGQCVLLDDFRERATDSRMWGTVPIANIEAVVGITYWPAGRWKMLR